ncbi:MULTISPECIES: hypothetical protein [Aequorivita]|uniref:Uncharacterized protein n=1 Tax=Aequorivita xiaoshiensis TaxID=2874476 RepID=A0A9X1R1A7_9FLAO|nr:MULTISPECIES: hypothetical protein [Aequorivita]MCG2430112.1 hypothetical protein [Aequorivita xiaoshiensis]
MKKLFFTLAFCLFSLGAFAANSTLIENNEKTDRIELITETENLISDNCEILVTVITTINHGTWIEVIVETFTLPC